MSHFNCIFRLTLKTDTRLIFLQILSLRTQVLSITGINQQMLFRERIAYCKDRMKIIRVVTKIYNFSPANLLHTSLVHFFAIFQKRYTVKVKVKVSRNRPEQAQGVPSRLRCSALRGWYRPPLPQEKSLVLIFRG